jgi:hypothetical protein
LQMQWQFAAIGIAAAQTSIKNGTNYEASLALCKDQLAFLGTGAHKLTQAKNFEDVIKRVNDSTDPVRLLLSCPQNEEIAEAAKLAGQPSGQYSRNITESLARLARLRKQRCANIQVRFYKDLQPFRMMFVNGSILLLSYNNYGKGDGSQSPQLVLMKSNIFIKNDETYSAYKQYFEKLWNRSEAWNPDDYNE